MQVYWLAFYPAELHAEFIWLRTFLLFTPVSFHRFSDGCVSSHLQIQNAVHHNHRARVDLHTSTEREDVTVAVSEQRLSYTSTNIAKTAVMHINKRNRDNLFASRANIDRMCHKETRLNFSCIYFINEKCCTILTRRSNMSKCVYICINFLL